MKVSARRVLGATLCSLPFVAIYAYACSAFGLAAGSMFLGVVLCVPALIAIGVYLIDGAG